MICAVSIFPILICAILLSVLLIWKVFGDFPFPGVFSLISHYRLGIFYWIEHVSTFLLKENGFWVYKGADEYFFRILFVKKLQEKSKICFSNMEQLIFWVIVHFSIHNRIILFYYYFISPQKKVKVRCIVRFNKFLNWLNMVLWGM